MKHWHGVAALGLGTAMLLGGTVGAGAFDNRSPTKASHSSVTSAAHGGANRVLSALGIGDDESQVAPGTLDDGKDLLAKAGITLDQAIAAAQGAASGDVGEVDLETYNGTLVFNVDIGDHDVKVDASTGSVLSADLDD